MASAFVGELSGTVWLAATVTVSLVAAVPLQWLAYWTSRVRGLDPDGRSHLKDSPRYIVSRKYR